MSEFTAIIGKKMLTFAVSFGANFEKNSQNGTFISTPKRAYISTLYSCLTFLSAILAKHSIIISSAAEITESIIAVLTETAIATTGAIPIDSNKTGFLINALFFIEVENEVLSFIPDTSVFIFGAFLRFLRIIDYFHNLLRYNLRLLLSINRLVR